MTDVPHATVAVPGSSPGCGVSARPLPEWALASTGTQQAGSGDARNRVRHRTKIGSTVTARASARSLQFTTTSERPVISPILSHPLREGSTFGELEPHRLLITGGAASAGCPATAVPWRPRLDWQPQAARAPKVASTTTITMDANPVPSLTGRPAHHSSHIRPTPVDFAGSTPAVGPQTMAASNRTTKRLTFRVSDPDRAEKIERLVDAGVYPNESEVARDGIDRVFDEHDLDDGGEA